MDSSSITDQITRCVPQSVQSRLRNSKIEESFRRLRWLSNPELEQLTIETEAGDVELSIPPWAEGWFDDGGGDYESGLTHELIDILGPEDVFYDVGSQFGYYAKLASLCGVGSESIHAFEADDRRADVLRGNVSDGVTVVNRFVSTDSGSEKVQLDDYVRSNPPSVVKVDVEGAEWDVLKGMENTLRDRSPILYVETHPVFLPDFGKSPRDVHDLLQRHGYEIHVEDHRTGEEWFPLQDADEITENQTYLIRARKS